MSREEWSELKRGSKIKNIFSKRVYEVEGVALDLQRKSSYPDYNIFNPSMNAWIAMICENWEVVK